MTTATKEPTTTVEHIEDTMPYVAPPVPEVTRTEMFGEELLEYAEMYFDEAKYHRERKEWDKANTASAIQTALTRAAKDKDPEAAATNLLYGLSYQMTAIRDAISESRRAVTRAEARAAAKAKDQAQVDAWATSPTADEVKAFNEKTQAERNAVVIGELREKLAKKGQSPAAIAKFEVGPGPKA